MKSIWLFKSESDTDACYLQKLSQINFSPEIVPTLEFSYQNETALKSMLESPSGYSGIVFTSMRSVEAVSRIYRLISVSLHNEWKSKKIFVIGKATQEALKTKIYLSGMGEESGNAVQLGEIILKNTAAFDKPLLYPCGNLKREELPNILTQNDRDFEAITTYQTKAHSSLENSLKNLLLSGKTPDVLVFFSPSGVQFTIPLLRKMKLDFVKCKFVAIGPATNAALVKENIPVWAICPEPSAEGLLSCLKPLQ